jgi:hypothetical protein
MGFRFSNSYFHAVHALLDCLSQLCSTASMHAALLLLLLGQANAQNLLNDPGFESGSEDFCGIMGANDFGENLSEWTSPTQGTPQLFFTNLDSDCWNAQPTSTYPGHATPTTSTSFHTGTALSNG